VNKKKQKNFINWTAAKHHNAMLCRNLLKVFCLFFPEKRTCCFASLITRSATITDDKIARFVELSGSLSIP